MSGAETLPRVGYIGLGNMGSAMALNLVDRGWPMILYARRAETLAPFRDLPVTIRPTPAAVGRDCAILCLCVVDMAQIEEVLFGRDRAVEGLAAGSVVVVHSTVAPADCRALASRLARHAIGFLDAPVTGGDARGRDGSLTIAVGGSGADLARCRDLLDAAGEAVIHLGGVGAGQVGKLINNALFISQLSLVDEMRRIAARLGVDPDAARDIIVGGTASSWAARFHAGSGRDGRAVFSAYETSYPGGVLAIVEKDIGLFMAELEQHGLTGSRMGVLASGAVDHMPGD